MNLKVVSNHLEMSTLIRQSFKSFETGLFRWKILTVILVLLEFLRFQQLAEEAVSLGEVAAGEAERYVSFDFHDRYGLASLQTSDTQPDSITSPFKCSSFSQSSRFFILF
mmetsp:Transcript_200/g.309  ORF Transcript_200/g.309 Transcript_200/m.309 type:complete len:110 (+) Transcript_200:2675-3004(+)